MSTTAAPAPVRPSGRPADSVEALYTICSVFDAATIAVAFGWIEEEFKRAGASLRYLWSLDADKGYLPHFSHDIDAHLFRDGGAIPAIWARADVADTTLIGATFGHVGGQILVRADADIHRLADLKGRKIGLYRSLNTGKVDFTRATSERVILLALGLAGLGRDDAQIVDIDEPDNHQPTPSAKPSDFWAANDLRGRYVFNNEIKALRQGRVDAVVTDYGRSELLVTSGEFRVIADFDRHPDWTFQVANSPWTITVDTALTREHPEVVVAYLRAVVRAGRWANAHREAAAGILHGQGLFYPTVEDVSRTIARTDFVPRLSPLNLAALEIQKNFLRDHGYIKRDFDVRQWADSRFLEEALRTV